MPHFQDIDNIRLASCCIASIQSINEILESTKLLGPILVVSSIGLILYGHPKDPGLGFLVNAYLSIKGNDMESLAETVKGIPAFAREEICNIIAAEALMKHATGNLHKFWMANSIAFQCE